MAEQYIWLELQYISEHYIKLGLAYVKVSNKLDKVWYLEEGKSYWRIIIVGLFYKSDKKERVEVDIKIASWMFRTGF